MSTSPLITSRQFDAPDLFYEYVIDAHRDLTTDQSHQMNAALVLLLSNHIGDIDVIREALRIARDTVQSTRPRRAS